MKNFFKKLSFVLALAMVLTSIAPATASAATKNYIAKKDSKQASTVYVFIGGSECDLDYSDASVKGTWKSADESIAEVDKNGVITPVANGKVKISFVSKDGKTLAKQTVRVCTRAAKLNVYDYAEYAAGTKNVLNNGEYKMTVGEKKDLQITMPISKAKKAAGGVSSSYASYCVGNTDPSVVAVTKVNDRKYTLEAKAAGESTITIAANQTSEANVLKGTKFVKADFTVKVEAEQSMSVEATGAKELTITLSTAADAKADVVVKRGTTTVSVSDVKAVGNKLVLTTNGKMVAGTYTATIGELSASCDVEDEYVKEIVIVDENSHVAMKADGKEAYVYYDVLNQYGESIRTSVTVTWTSSMNANSVSDDKVNGCITLSSTTALNYGATIYITGVYSKAANVVTKQATVLAGLPAKADSVEFAGVVKKNTTTFTTLPVSFAADTYLLAFKVKDQYNHPYTVNSPADVRDELTFTTNAPLLMTIDEKLSGAYPGDVTIDGETYTTVWAQPGDYAMNGGAVVVSAISSGTGKMSSKEIVVAEDQILTTFKMSAPSDIISEGRTVMIPFTALDQNGEAITSYRVLLDNLTLSATKGSLFMKELDDGSAVLMYSAAGTWTTDEIDDLVTITSVVAKTGSFDSQTLYIKDRAYPAAISSVGGAKTLLEGGSVYINKVYSTSFPYFTYVDQYGRDMVQTSTSPVIDAEINDYFGNHNLYVEFTGNTFVAGVNGDKTGVVVTANPIPGAGEFQNSTIAFSLVKANGSLVSGSTKKVTYTSADISKVVSFKTSLTGATVYGYNTNGVTNTGLSWNDQQTGVSVTGYLADGTEVNVPYVYSGSTYYYDVTVGDATGYTDIVSQGAITLATGAAINNNLSVPTFAVDCTGVSGTYLFKDKYSAGNPYRNEQFKVYVTINDVNVVDNGKVVQKDKLVETVSVGKLAPAAAAFVGMAPTKLTVNPSSGIIGNAQINYDGQLYWFVVDQYGKLVFTAPTITFSKIVESENNANASSIAVSSNASTTAQITGAEIGDTFTVTYSIEGTGASITVDVVVGADSVAGFSNAGKWSPRY